MILSQFMFPETNATSDLLTSLAVDLSARGFKVIAYCAQPTYFGARSVPSRLEHMGVTIRRLRSTQLGRGSMLWRLIDGVTFVSRLLLEVPRFPDDAVVLVVTNPPFLPMIGAISRLVFGKPFVLLVHDVYPEIAIRLGVLRQGGIAHRLLKALDRFVLSQADAVVVLGRDMRQRIVDKSPASRHGRITVIPNWADPDQISPMLKSDSPSARRYGLLDTFVVQYSGNLGLSQPFDTILGAAKELKGRDINFTFVGDGVMTEEVKARAVALELDNVRFFPRACGDDLGSSLAASDVAIVPLLPGVEGLSVPSKYYGILASGRPVIALMSPGAEVAQSVIENRCGVVVPPLDIERLASAVLELQKDRDRLAQLGRNARAAFDRLHTRRHTVDAYEEILMRVGRQCHRTSPGQPERQTI